MPSESGNEIDEIATGWVARLDSEDWTSAEEEALDAWLGQDKRHQGAFLHAHALWLALDPAADQEAAKAKVDHVRRGFVLGGGAALAASLVGGVALWRKGHTITTAVGEIRRLPLPDGSVAAINTASEMKIAYADHHRDIDLRRGEAWFQVSSNPRRPFLVEAGAVRVLAVGTAFSVRRRDQGADILVTEGVVRAWTEGRDHEGVQLRAGDHVFLSDTAQVRRSAARSIDQALAWRNGRIDLQGETLSAAIDEFNRYNQRQLVLEDPALASERLDGFFRTDDVEGFAKALRVTFNVPVSIDPVGEIRIGSRGSHSL
ncbi:FecR domain-containing protein [Sphingomonas sp. BIUV-7]|uniref:FecR domain-containing protein n=1 Tax=Sphingomonas natans TaxID=3063330 RepID=A0ABT8Y8I9_9SPHN|nr:FecR domain-containing protein [Sphingomonas sp. BIUV-7]MDO6414633.1 FecR domain-containing protein [Sphingomonas sp. BIUV-7]